MAAVTSACYCCCLLLLVAAVGGADAINNGHLLATCGSGADASKVDAVPEIIPRFVTLNSLILDWIPPNRDYDKPFSYLLSCTGVGCPAGEVSTTENTHEFTNLAPASVYYVSITAGLVNCNSSDPKVVVGRTQLSPLQGSVTISDVTETSFKASWTASPDAGVTYVVSCAPRTSLTWAVCLNQLSGTAITVEVRAVKADFPGTSQSIQGTARTKLFAVEGSSARFTKNATAIGVSWDASKTAGVSYELACRGRGAKTNVTTDRPEATCSSLASGQPYNVSVAVKKTGFENAVTDLGSHLTMLSAVEASSARFTKNATAISAFWAASKTVEVSYELVCMGPSGGRQNVTTDQTEATCSSLESGQPYRISVAVKKPGGFEDAVTDLGTHLTNLFAVEFSSVRFTKNATAIGVSWDASKTSSVSYELACRGPGTNKKVSTEHSEATCSSLTSGQPYQISVTVKKPGGFEDAVTDLGTHWTKLFLSTDSAHFGTSVVVNGNAGTAKMQLKVSWTPEAARGANSMLVRATTDKLNLQSTANFSSYSTELSLPGLFSDRLNVSVTALADKPGLNDTSENSYSTAVPTPPNRPLISLKPEKRSIKVTLQPTSRSDILCASVNRAPVSCNSSVDPGSNCSVTLPSLKPYTIYRLVAWAEFNNLSSLLSSFEIRTLEDAPSLPESVTANASLPGDRVTVRWDVPVEQNGVITHYTVDWGQLDFASRDELTKESNTTSTTSLEVPADLPGQEQYFYVAACTGGGCSNRSGRATLLTNDAETRAMPAVDVAVSNTSVTVAWQPLNFSQGVVFEYLLLFVEQSRNECVTAQRVSCSNCHRSRDQLTKEGRSRLDSLTRGCSGVGAGASFGYQDVQVSTSASVQPVSYSGGQLVPWTKYTVTVRPVNRAGPGAANLSEFRTQEAPSGAVRNLTVSGESLDAARVEFAAPERQNGLLLAYAVQVFGRHTGGSQCSLTLINVTAESCQLPQCSTDQLVADLVKECGGDLATLVLENSTGLMQLRVGQLQPDVTYTVRVTPISQTLAGLALATSFSLTPPPPTKPDWLVIGVSVAVSVAVLLAIVAVAAVIVYRRRSGAGYGPSNNQTVTSTLSVYADTGRSARDSQTTIEDSVYDTLEEVKDEPIPNQDQFTNWSTQAVIYKGEFSEVLEVLLPDGSIRCAAKVVKLTVEPAKRKPLALKMQKLLEQEQHLCELKHCNIVRFLHLAQPESCTVVLFMELLNCRSLHSFIQSRPLNEEVILALSRQICCALDYLHSLQPPVVHGDLSSCSIAVLTGSERVKLLDFGLSAKVQAAANNCAAASRLASVQFMSPELFSQDKLQPSPACDIWAFGCTVYHMATGSPPYSSCSNLWAIPELVRSQGAATLPEGHCSGELLKFYAACVSRHPGGRATARYLLQHRFLSHSR